MLPLLSMISVLQIGITTMNPPVTRYQFIVTPENNSPVALCDTDFHCHCPVGYQALIQQSAFSIEAVSVTCEAVSSGAAQPRETYDSYPILPFHENKGR